MKYMNINEFSAKAKKSVRTVYRFYKKNAELKNEAKKKGIKNFYPTSHLKYFNSEIMYDECKVLELENKSMKNLIDELMDKNSFIRELWDMEWNFFYTIAYKFDRSKKSCFRLMHAIYEMLDEKYGNNTDIRMFFTTEPFKKREGHHNHFTLYVKNRKLREQIVKSIEDYFKYDRIDCRIYNHYKAGLFYMTKKGLVNEDWDFLGNNLPERNIENEV